MKNNGLKNAKAITLIAMVVTIIVLLILVGVSIAVLTGENGIINRTTEVKKTNEEAEVMENIRLAYNNAQIGKYAGKNESFIGTLKSDLEKVYGTGENNVKVEDNGNDTYTVTIRGKKYTIDENGNVNKVEGFSITSTTLNLQKRVGVDATGTTITATKDGIDGTVHWSISPATGVATLSSDTGDAIQVTPVASADDSAVITATCGSYTKQCTVNVTLVSKVNVTFNFNGGTLNSNSSQTFNEFPGDIITLPVPTAPDENHTFGGWYDNSELTGDPAIAATTETITTPTANTTYYAKWIVGYGAIGTQVYLNNNSDITITFGANDTATIPDDWRVFYEDENNVYLIYGHYYPVAAQRNTDQSTITFAGGSKTYAVSDSTNRTNLLRYLRNNSAYSWNNTSPYGDDNGTNGVEYTSWSKLKTALSGLSSLSGKTIKVYGSPDIELWTNSWNAKGNTELDVTKEASGYNIIGSNSYDFISLSGSGSSLDQTGYYDELYFPYREDQTMGTGYWIASPGAASNNSVCHVMYSGAFCCNAGYSSSYAIYSARPVIAIEK